MSKTSGSTSHVPPRSRRTQEERTASTRAKLIAAAIDCLARLGFTDATTAVIAQAAGTSRGAMLHHFPSKDELLIAVVEHVLDDSLSDYSKELMAIADPRERLLAAPALAWKNILTPGYMAWLEIWLGTRANAGLADQFRASYERVNKRAAASMRQLAKDAGVADLRRIEDIRVLFLASMRGLAIEAVIAGRIDHLQPAVAEMRRLFEQAIPAAAPGSGVRPARSTGAPRKGRAVAAGAK
jgi:AcrR family transcriptional regulator